MRTILRVCLMAAALAFIPPARDFPPPAHADAGWKEEFEAVCSRTDAAMTLTREDLLDLVGRCDRLKDRIETEEESTRKVYMRRLKSCRDLYLYMIETKKGE